MTNTEYVIYTEEDLIEAFNSAILRLNYNDKHEWTMLSTISQELSARLDADVLAKDLVYSLGKCGKFEQNVNGYWRMK